MAFSTPLKWTWRLCVALWLLLCAPFVLVVLLTLVEPLVTGHPLSYFERRDPSTCPGYYERYDDAVLACIHQAGEAQSHWMMTRLPLESAVASAPWMLFLLWIPLAGWALFRLFRRARTSVANFSA